MKTIKDRLITLFFYFSILFFIIGFQFSDIMVGNWYQQFMPYPVGGQVRDITFLDSLTGFTVTDSCILKTNNGGDNWTLKTQGYYIFKRIQFLNHNTGFGCGANNKLLKTTNSGENWTIITPSSIYPLDMSVLSEDTIWLVDNNSLVGGVFRTTNGGVSWERQPAPPSDHIYMYNSLIGFISGNGLRKTTDGGASWIFINGAGNFLDMYFADSLTGWKCNLDMKKTTDGGFNWITQTLPSGGNIVINGISKFSNVNIDTIWGVGGVIQVSGGGRGMVFRTINGGNNWLFQVPDTNYNIFRYFHNKFVNKAIGWAYAPLTGVHTTTGGDPIFYTGIKQMSSTVPDGFKLEQNFPNPFNPITNFKLRIPNFTKVQVNVYDVNGRLVTTLINKEIQAGEYAISFDGTHYTSGIYFYSLFIDGKLVDTKRMILLK